jgi:hypothetical protein
VVGFAHYIWHGGCLAVSQVPISILGDAANHQKQTTKTVPYSEKMDESRLALSQTCDARATQAGIDNRNPCSLISLVTDL